MNLNLLCVYLTGAIYDHEKEDQKFSSQDIQCLIGILEEGFSKNFKEESEIENFINDKVKDFLNEI